MKVFTLNSEQFIPADIQTVWDFFSSPDNLKVITPKYLGFKILSPKDRQNIFTGMEISYTVKPLLGIPLKWITQIAEVNAPNAFVDIQKKGPYKLWRHRHQFKEVEGGVLMTDTVNYVLPLGKLGEIAHSLFVHNQLKGIFKYRKKVVEDLFGDKK
jgi:ligand-binding SRPBCC domain-containing protein